MIEVWKDIKGYEGLYKISNLGNVYSCRKSRNLKPYLWSGYPNVNLVKEHKRKGVQIHRLVAQAFIQNPNNYKIVNHKDYNRTNANVENLEWCTQKHNVNYSKCNMQGKNHIFKDKEKYGIFYRKEKNKYEVTIKKRYYGSFNSFIEAKKKRDEVLSELNIAI